MSRESLNHGIIWPQSGFVPRRRITIRGWCFCSEGDGIEGVRAVVNEGRVFRGTRKQPTFALGIDFPGSEEANYAGYRIELELPRGRSVVRVECRPKGSDEWVTLEDLELLAPWLWEGPERCKFDYKLWLSRYDARTAWDIEAWRDVGFSLEFQPTFSFVVKAGDSYPRLKRTLISLRAQVYGHWNVRVEGAEDFPPLPFLGEGRILEPSAELTGDYVALMDSGDRLAPHALAWVARSINECGGEHPLVLYSDDDVADAQGQRGDPWFKPDWDIEYFLSRDFLSRSGYFLRSEFGDNFGDHSQLARTLKRRGEKEIVHIPALLYHRGVRPEMEGCGVRKFHPLPSPLPKVDIIIPTRDRLGLLRVAVESIRRRTDYDRFEILIVDNDSREPETVEYLEALAEDENGGVRVLRHPGAFNFAAINNFAARESDADVLVFMNNDVEVLSPGWLRSMVELAIQEKIGAVGAHLLYPDRTVQHAGVFLGFRDTAGHLFRQTHLDAPDLMRRMDVVHQVSAVTAACMVVERVKFLVVKGFNAETFPVSVNDVDFCLKLIGAGFRNVVCPDAELIHRESASRGEAEADPKRKEAAKQEMLSLYYRWPELVAADPFYNPNLTLQYEDVSLAEPPRVITGVNGGAGGDLF